MVVKSYLLQLILGVRDLNEGNMGSSIDNMLSVVNFYVSDCDFFLQREIFEDFQNKSNFGGVGPANEISIQVGKEERIAIAKEAVPQWSRINSLSIDIIDNEKKEIRMHGIKIGSATQDVNRYLQDIKTNYASLCSALPAHTVPILLKSVPQPTPHSELP